MARISSLDGSAQTKGDDDHNNLRNKRVLMLMWVAIGFGPLVLQLRGYATFVTPHKISQNLVTPANGVLETVDLHQICPVNELYMAGAWWNISPTHYYRVEGGVLCHYLMPQYNVHGNYFLGDKKTTPYRTTPESCADDSYPFENYFYHGSIGYYTFYMEGEGTLCLLDRTAYDKVRGLGTFDINGSRLASDGGNANYRKSYWYAFTGIGWAIYRSWVVRRSFISCKRFISRFVKRQRSVGEHITLQDAIVFVQESMRLSAHGANNYHRLVLLFFLLDLGLMGDLFLLITQEGFVGRVQCISLGYNLSGIISIIFEMIETMQWMKEKTRCLVKRLLLNYETALLGELFTAVAIQYYLTSLNRSSLRNTESEAKAVSYYVMSLVGHGCIALGCLLIIICTRIVGTLSYVYWKYRSLAILTEPCCVDETLGARCKLILLAGYVWRNNQLFYKVRTLKTFGLLKVTEEDGSKFLVYSKLHWFGISRQDLVVCGIVSGSGVKACEERPCFGVLSQLDSGLGGGIVETSSRRSLGTTNVIPLVHNTDHCAPCIADTRTWVLADTNG